jgi:hypothetical protein
VAAKNNNPPGNRAMNFTNTDCVRNMLFRHLHGFKQFHEQVELPLIRKTDLDLWEWVLAQTYKIRNKISQEIER